MYFKTATLLTLWIIISFEGANGRPSLEQSTTVSPTMKGGESTLQEGKSDLSFENGALEFTPKNPPESLKRSLSPEEIEMKDSQNSSNSNEDSTEIPKTEKNVTLIEEESIYVNGSQLSHQLDSGQRVPTQKMTLQLDPAQAVPSVFYVPFSLNNTPSENEAKEYRELKEISKGHFLGYGKNSVADFLPGGIPADENPLLKECQIDNGIPFKICASDGHTYDNLSQFYCVQIRNKDLQLLWDGPCNRTEWPTVLWKPDQPKMEVLDPEEIIKYFI